MRSKVSKQCSAGSSWATAMSPPPVGLLQKGKTAILKLTAYLTLLRVLLPHPNKMNPQKTRKVLFNLKAAVLHFSSRTLGIGNTQTESQGL